MHTSFRRIGPYHMQRARRSNVRSSSHWALVQLVIHLPCISAPCIAKNLHKLLALSCPYSSDTTLTTPRHDDCATQMTNQILSLSSASTTLCFRVLGEHNWWTGGSSVRLLCISALPLSGSAVRAQEHERAFLRQLYFTLWRVLNKKFVIKDVDRPHCRRGRLLLDRSRR